MSVSYAPLLALLSARVWGAALFACATPPALLGARVWGRHRGDGNHWLVSLAEALQKENWI